MEEVVLKLKEKDKKIATMESCTGGALVNAITNIEGASDVLNFSAITYSNEFKIKMGVSSKIIDTYSVYSMETALEMSKNIALYTKANYGVGITGKLNRPDNNNLKGKDNLVYISIYDYDLDKYYKFIYEAKEIKREANKEQIIKLVKEKLLEII